MTAPGSCPPPLPQLQWASGSLGLWLREHSPLEHQKGAGEWKARSRVAGGRRGSSTSVGPPAWSLPQGGCTNLPVEAPGTTAASSPMATASADQAALLALSPAAWTESSISAGRKRGPGRTVGPPTPVTGRSPSSFATVLAQTKQVEPFSSLWQSLTRLPSEALQRAPPAGEGAPSQPCRTGTVCLALASVGLTVAGEQALPWQLPEDDASASVQRCLLGESEDACGLSNWSVPGEPAQLTFPQGSGLGMWLPEEGFFSYDG